MRERVVIVTGGGRGIGRAICEKFASQDTQLVAAARSRDDLEQTCERCAEAGGRCHTSITDVTEPDEIQAMIQDTIERFGRVDVLVNNAGIAPRAKIDELDPNLFESIFSVNCLAVYHASRAVWPIMSKQGGGVIINISSMSSVDPFPGFTGYGAAKAWVNAWTKGLAEEGRSVNIRVFCVAPGAVETKMLRDAFPDFPTESTLPPAEIANVVYALSLNEYKYATGQTIFVRK